MPRAAKPLTEIRLRAAKPKAKMYKLFDGNGLYLEVPITGNPRWRLKYFVDGREKLLSFGVYPEVTLKEARERRDDARKLLRNGNDPGHIRQTQRREVKDATERNFQAACEAWLEHKRDSWSPTHVERVALSLKDDAYPLLAHRPTNAIVPQEVLAVIKAVEARGALDVAARVAQRVSSVFRNAILNGWCATNPAAELRGVIKQRKVQHRAALARADLPEFLTNLDNYDGRPETRIGLQLLLLTWVRPGEMRFAVWSEFDFDRAEWRIPAERMKMGDEHIVPLATQTLAVLDNLKKYTSWSPLLFPGTGTGDKPISENTLLYALYRMGYHKRATSHGFRALASTCLNEMGWRTDVIERQLAHAERNKVRAAYNRASYMQERRQMMQTWADFIDSQRVGAKVVPIRKRSAQENPG